VPTLVLALLACGSAPPAEPPHGAGHGSADPHAGHGAAGHAAAGHGAADPAAPANLHGSHSEHMKQMAATRERLRQELGAAYDAPVPGLDAADAAAGKAVYDQSCAGCHGATGKGDGEAGKALNPPPSDMTDAFHARYYSDAGRVHVVRKGSPGTSMAGFEGALSEEQILAVYKYVAGFRAPLTP
jgi:mono/diheme cytochrome c family protein